MSIFNAALVPVKNYNLFNISMSSQLYLGYARIGLNPWGSYSTIKITPLYVSAFIENYIPIATDSSSVLSQKFFDNNVSFNGITPSSGSNVVYIGKIPIGSELTNSSSLFTILSSSTIGSLTLNYLNQNYCSISGLNPAYNFSDSNDYDYYILNYNQYPLSAIKIDRLNNPQFIGNSSSVQIAYSLTNANYYSTILSIGSLTQLINNQGQLNIYGMTSGYNLSSNIQSANFFILDSNNNIILSGLKYSISGTDTSGNAYINFTYGNSLTLTLTSQEPIIQSLAVFNENNVSGTINDSNPPQLTYNYLLQDYLRYSIFDPAELFQIPSQDIWYAMLIGSNSQSESFYQNLGMIIQPIGNNNYALTQNANLASGLNFTNVFINFNADYITEYPNLTYRQAFLCLNPQNASGNYFNTSFILGNQLFQTNTYSYNLGQILWLSNLNAINRFYVTLQETYQIIL